MPMIPPPRRHPYEQWSPDARALDLVGDKWTLLIVRDLASGQRRFTELQRVLPGISIEQLRSRLGRMVAEGLLLRHEFPERAPRVEYELTPSGMQLLPVVGALARWGYAWAWGTPRDGEIVDIGAILRMAPGLASMPVGAFGVVELRVGSGITAAHHALTISSGTASIAERQATDADARISGSEEDWIEALGPAADRSMLCIEGDDRLAVTVLELIGPQPPDRIALS